LISDPIYKRARLLLLVAACAITAAVWVASGMQRHAGATGLQASRASDRMLVAILDEADAARSLAGARTGAAVAGAKTAADGFRAASREFSVALELARSGSDGDRAALHNLDEQAAIEQGFASIVGRAFVVKGQPHGYTPPVDVERQRRTAVTAIRSGHTIFQQIINQQRQRAEQRAAIVSAALVLVLVAVFAALAYVLIVRAIRREVSHRLERQAFQDQQTDFAETMQVTQSEQEAHELLQRHIERSVDGSRVIVLNRNNSANRLDATTTLPDDASGLMERLSGAEPRSCMAIRLGRNYDRQPGDEPLLACALCGAEDRSTTCQPLLVGGEVIGSVLVEHDAGLDGTAERRVRESVTQAAPVLANLRNLAIAELRAATDALTGLPNARAVQDTLRRMIAQAGRTMTPVAAVLLDLDHFKLVNDTYGHGKGDEVLAVVGDVLANTVRTSDFVGRSGGEEFLMLLPATDRDGALKVAESVRAAIARITVPLVERPITASLGVAVMPQDAGDAETLVRMADRALYAAKAAGRDRVELAHAHAPLTMPQPDVPPFPALDEPGF